MSSIQQMNAPEGSYFITIPKDLIESTGWKKGDEMGFFIVGQSILPEKGDIILRRVRG